MEKKMVKGRIMDSLLMIWKGMSCLVDRWVGLREIGRREGRVTA
jgi:hypothetical protein